MTGRIKIPVSELEFDVDGKSIWVHSPDGHTVLRVGCKRIKVSEDVDAHLPVHANKEIGVLDSYAFCDVLTNLELTFHVAKKLRND